jgi:hypothetical protein
MRKVALIVSLLIFPLFSLLSYGETIKIHKLSVEEGKRFEKFGFNKIWEMSFFSGGWCLPCPQGIVCDEVLDRTGKEFEFKLYDYLGKLLKERKMTGGKGPDEIDFHGWDRFQLSSSGKILVYDSTYLKAIDPETLKIETIVKYSNVIEGYENKYTFGLPGSSSLEEKNNRTVTFFESTAFYEDLTYYIVTYNGIFENFSVIATAIKERPMDWQTSRKRELYVDYYRNLRLGGILSVDWKRGIVYHILNIEKPEIESVDLEGKRKEKYVIDIHPEKFRVEREDFDLIYKSNLSQVDPVLKNLLKFILHIPPHAPALVGIKVRGDWLMVITGNRNWKKGENEVLVYKLPSLTYEGSFFIPFPNQLRTMWHDDYYIIRNLIEKEDGYYLSHEIYRLEEK